MKTIAPHVARVLLGLVFLVFGLNGFLHFLPMPPPPPEAVGYFTFLTGSYLFTLVKGTEVLVAVLLLSNRFVPLALALLAPVTVNILLFHATVEGPATLGLPVVLVALQLYLAWHHREVYAPLFRPRATRAGDAKASAQGRLASAA
ncbi:MAG: DoxX family protein [Archangiaceae bacterium]|nr:DoxX family protein [Archangiaceae bacterium]